MKKVILSIGIPGSGKSTLINDFLNSNSISQPDEEYFCVSPDEIRSRPEFKKDTYDPSDNKKVWSIARTELARNLIDGKNVVFDATFVTSRNRKEIIEFIRDVAKQSKLEIKIQGVYFKTDLEVAKRRNSIRNDKSPLPEGYLESSFDTLEVQKPDKSEGFDSLIVINNSELKVGEKPTFKNIVK